MHSKALSGALATMAALVTAPVAMSQEAPAAKPDAEEVDEIIVSGYRASLQSALEVKRNSFFECTWRVASGYHWPSETRAGDAMPAGRATA